MAKAPSSDSVRATEILGDPTLLYQGVDYARDTLGTRWSEWEERVLEALEDKRLDKDQRELLADECVRYAREVINGQWEALEDRLILPGNLWQGKAFFDYMKQGSITVRWSEDREQKLIRPHLYTTYLYAYATLGIHARLPLAEETILSTLKNDSLSRVWWKPGLGYATEVCATEYALHMMDGSWPAYGRMVLSGECTPWVAVDYAEKILQRPHPNIEQYLASWKSPPRYRYDDYDFTIALERYLKAFPSRSANIEAWLFRQRASEVAGKAISNYTETIVPGCGKRFLLAHRKNMKPSLFRTAVVLYAERVIKGRWRRIEKWLVKSPRHMLEYADRVVKGKLPAYLHNAMVMMSCGDNNDSQARSIRKYVRRYGV